MGHDRSCLRLWGGAGGGEASASRSRGEGQSAPGPDGWDVSRDGGDGGCNPGAEKHVQCPAGPASGGGEEVVKGEEEVE